MSQRKGDLYTFGFATVICVVCAVILALAATALKPRQQANVELDVLVNILGTVGHDVSALKKQTADEVFQVFQKEFETLLLNKDNQPVNRADLEQALATVGYPTEELSAQSASALLTRYEGKKALLARRAGEKMATYEKGYKLLYKHMNSSDEVDAYVIPIDGYGLWDNMKGCLALEADLNTVKGITFYEHKETPGLGARVTEAAWQAKWAPENAADKKKILDENGTLISIIVAKGNVTDDDPLKSHKVDGISGATLTGNGVNEFLKADLERYEPYFQTLRSQRSGR